MKLNGTIWECPDSMYGAKIEFPIDDEGFGVFTKYSDKMPGAFTYEYEEQKAEGFIYFMGDREQNIGIRFQVFEKENNKTRLTLYWHNTEHFKNCYIFDLK